MPADFRRRKLTINGKPWTVRTFEGYVPPGEKEPMYGLCDYTERVIWIRRQQRDAELLDTLVHEVLHAVLPHLSERDVTTSARTIAAALLACGVL
jgi:hypothetical protein